MAGLPVVLSDTFRPTGGWCRWRGAPGQFRLEHSGRSWRDPVTGHDHESLHHLVLLQTSQSGACNAHHSLRQRLARWLLLASNSLESARLPLTHDVLARLLGVRRASVSECLEVLETEGLIKNSRGLVQLAEPEKLQQTCCDCYRIISREYDRLFPATQLRRLQA